MKTEHMVSSKKDFEEQSWLLNSEIKDVLDGEHSCSVHMLLASTLREQNYVLSDADNVSRSLAQHMS